MLVAGWVNKLVADVDVVAVPNPKDRVGAAVVEAAVAAGAAAAVVAAVVVVVAAPNENPALEFQINNQIPVYHG